MPGKFVVLRLNFQKKKRRSLLFDFKNDLKNDLVKKNTIQYVATRGFVKTSGG